MSDEDSLSINIAEIIVVDNTEDVSTTKAFVSCQFSESSSFCLSNIHIAMSLYNIITHKNNN